MEQFHFKVGDRVVLTPDKLVAGNYWELAEAADFIERWIARDLNGDAGPYKVIATGALGQVQFLTDDGIAQTCDGMWLKKDLPESGHKLLFNKNLTFGKVIPLDLSQDELRHVPQFYRASAEYAYRLGGPAVRRVIDSIPLDPRFKYVSIDSRVHMLMPGWLPCIGGWHCDDFWRPSGKQPDLGDISIENDSYCKHHTLTYGPVSMTEFCTTPVEFPVYSEEQLRGKNLYALYSDRINKLIARGEVKTKKCESGQLVSFDSFAFHRGTVSEGHGWRLFLRITESNHWEPKNEIRTQTQVYLKDFEAGW